MHRDASLDICQVFASTDFPTLTDLIEVMKGAPKYTHNKEKIFELATRLGAWCDGGVYGNIFDGATTLDLRKKVVHFELGKIPESMGELKSACGLLVTGVVRQKILSMPRSARKRLIFEEVARFLNVAGGEQIVSEAYAQLRKFGCQTMAIVQQYAQFKNSKIRPVLIGNSKQYFIMRQQDRSDLEDLANDINLSSAAQEVIQNFSLPEYQSDNDRHSSVFYFNPTVKPDLAGVLKHFVTGCLVVMSGFLGGCGNVTKTTTRAGVIAGGGLVGHSLGKGDKWATAGDDYNFRMNHIHREEFEHCQDVLETTADRRSQLQKQQSKLLEEIGQAQDQLTVNKKQAELASIQSELTTLQSRRIEIVF